MIRSFAGRDTERLFNREPVRRFPAALQRTMLRKLVVLDGADVLQDLASPPGNRLETLARDRKGQFSIRVNDQYRICFIWTEDGPDAVEIVDYH